MWRGGATIKPDSCLFFSLQSLSLTVHHKSTPLHPFLKELLFLSGISKSIPWKLANLCFVCGEIPTSLISLHTLLEAVSVETASRGLCGCTMTCWSSADLQLMPHDKYLD